MSKILKNLLSIFLMCGLLFVTINVKAQKDEEEKVEASVGSGYYVQGDLVEENHLKADLLHQKFIAYSSSSLTGFNAAGSGGGGINVPNQLYPQSVNLLYIPTTTSSRIINWVNTSSYGWQRGTVEEMAKNYERNNPGWKVIAAINGDFFDITSVKALPETASGSTVVDGEVLKTVGSTVLGFTNSGDTNTLIGDKKIQFTDYFVLTLYDDKGNVIKEFQVDNVNPNSAVSGLSLYYSFPTIVEGEGATAKREYSKATIPANGVVVKTADRLVPYSGGENASFYGKGKISVLSESYDITYKQFGVHSDDAEEMAAIKAATSIRVQRNVVGDFADANNISGTGVTLVKNGEGVVFNNNERHPRTMVGVKEDGTLVLCTVDGRHPEVEMYGMTYDEQAALMQAYGCKYAYNMDGGGSTTMLIREGEKFRVLNNPSDGNARRDANAILIVVPEISLSIDKVTDTEITISAPTNYVNMEISNIKVTINNQTYDLSGSLTISGLTPRETYQINYIYNRSYDGKTENVVGDPIDIKMGKTIPSVSNISYKYEDGSLSVNYDISDPDAAILFVNLYYTGGSKKIDINSNSIVIDGLKSLKPEDLEIVVFCEIDSSTDDSLNLVFDNFQEEQPAKKGGCGQGAYSIILFTSLFSIAFILLKKK